MGREGNQFPLAEGFQIQCFHDISLSLPPAGKRAFRWQMFTPTGMSSGKVLFTL